MNQSSFTRKKLIAQITLGKGVFGASGADVVTIPGVANQQARISVDIAKFAGLTAGTAQIQIYGLRQSVMNQLTMLAFHPLEFAMNTIDIFAGDEMSVSKVYSGTITAAFANYQGSPDVPLEISAVTNQDNKLKPADALSFKGATNVAQVMEMLAKSMGLNFENNGVDSVLLNQYLPGTGIQKAMALAAAAGIILYQDDDTLAICPPGVARAVNAQQIPLVSKNTGLIGYPAFDWQGVYFESLFNPALLLGGQVKIETEVDTANGQWRIISLAHTLESEKPDGAWFTRVWCTAYDFALKP